MISSWPAGALGSTLAAARAWLASNRPMARLGTRPAAAALAWTGHAQPGTIDTQLLSKVSACLICAVEDIFNANTKRKRKFD